MILLIFGEENFLSLQKLKNIKEKFASKDLENSNINELEVKSFSFAEFSKLSSSAPFLSEKRLIILKNILTSKINNGDEEKTIEYLSKIPESSVVIFYEDSNSIDNRRLLVKKVKNLAKKSWEFKKLTNQEAENWVKKELASKEGTITSPAFSKLLAFVGNNLWQLDKEIDKLVTYKNKKRIEEDDIEKLVSANLNTSVFELIDNIGEKNLGKSLKFLNNLIEQGEEVLYLLGMVIYQLRNLILIKDLALKNLPKSEIIKITKKHPYVVTKTLSQSKNFSPEELDNIYKRIFETELKIKTGRMEPKTALNLLVTKLCTKQ